MIFNIGTDIVSIKRIELALSKNPNFINRILTEKEVEIAKTKSPKALANYVAKRFSAKESFAKAFGTGIGKISFQDIMVLNKENGSPYYVISDKIATELQKITGKQEYKIHLSISDDTEYAISYVIIEVI